MSAEIEATLAYEHIAKRINEKNLKSFIFFEQELATFINVNSVINACRDAKDNFLLALAKDAGADYLITRDDDLLVLSKFESTVILTLSQFTEIINQQTT